MRIAFLSAANSIHTQRWVIALAQRGHKVELYSLPEHRAKPDSYPDEIGVHYLHKGGIRGCLLNTAELKSRLAEFRPDVLSAHYAANYGTLARKSGYDPFVLTVWGEDTYTLPGSVFFHRRAMMKNLDSAGVISASGYALADRLKNLYGRERKILVTPFGIDTEEFHTIASKRPPARDCLTIGMVKKLERMNGADDLLRAFAVLKESMIKSETLPAGGLRLHIYGSGSQTHSLMWLAASLKIGKETSFYGEIPHSHVPGVLSGMDIFCAPCLGDCESFGTAVIEAMACELPVVASDAIGFKEVITEGITGFNVPRKDFITLAKKLEILAHDPALRQKMGHEGRQKVLEKYRLAACVDSLESALKSAVISPQKLK